MRDSLKILVLCASATLVLAGCASAGSSRSLTTGAASTQATAFGPSSPGCRPDDLAIVVAGTLSDDIFRSDIFLVRGDGTATPITDDGQSFSPSVQVERSLVSFTKNTGGSVADAPTPPSELWLSRLDGSDARRVAYSQDITEQQLSPDGSVIALTAAREPARLPADTATPSSAGAQATPSGPAKSGAPSAGTDDTDFQAWTVDLAGDGARALIDPLSEYSRQGNLTWSPDGKLLAFTEMEETPGAGPTVLRIVDVATRKEVSRVEAKPDTLISGVSWSPTGNAVYAVARPQSGPLNVVRFDPAGGDSAQVVADVAEGTYDAITTGSEAILRIAPGRSGFSFIDTEHGLEVQTALREVGTPSSAPCLEGRR